MFQVIGLRHTSAVRGQFEIFIYLCSYLSSEEYIIDNNKCNVYFISADIDLRALYVKMFTMNVHLFNVTSYFSYNHLA